MIRPAYAQPDPTLEIRELIELEAARQKVPAPVALAFADGESGLTNIVGDAHRKDPLRRAYGPFQLQARWHLLAGEPLVHLLKLDVNIARGVSMVKWALWRSRGDALIARLMYVCGRQYEISCTEKHREEIRESWAIVWRRWRPRAVRLSSESVLCDSFPVTSDRGGGSWPQRRLPQSGNPKMSNVRWSRFEADSGKPERKSDAASRAESL